MEFYKEVRLDNDVLSLQEHLSIANLSQLCASIDKVIEDKISSGAIYCLWGQFAINREKIKKGIRFSLPDCPNALAWSITREDDEYDRQIVIHCTINKLQHEMEFIDSIHDFMGDWEQGLEDFFSTLRAK